MRYFFLFFLLFSFSNSYSTGLNNTNTLRIMTLNLAHGRGDNFHQLLISNAQIKNNLDNIIKISQREAPHVLAVQEADISAYLVQWVVIYSTASCKFSSRVLPPVRTNNFNFPSCFKYTGLSEGIRIILHMSALSIT